MMLTRSLGTHLISEYRRYNCRGDYLQTNQKVAWLEGRRKKAGTSDRQCLWAGRHVELLPCVGSFSVRKALGVEEHVGGRVEAHFVVYSIQISCSLRLVSQVCDAAHVPCAFI